MTHKPSLVDEFLALEPRQRSLVHFLLCRHALEQWNSFIRTQGKIQYVESVVGTHQEVDVNLPSEALSAVRNGYPSADDISARYQEPIVALQDEDLSLPEHITYAYYAIYNLFKKYAQGEAIDDWLIVNQALSAEINSDQWKPLLEAALHQARQET